MKNANPVLNWATDQALPSSSEPVLHSPIHATSPATSNQSETYVKVKEGEIHKDLK